MSRRLAEYVWKLRSRKQDADRSDETSQDAKDKGGCSRIEIEGDPTSWTLTGLTDLG
jgi:hypothetical protein